MAVLQAISLDSPTISTKKSLPLIYGTSHCPSPDSETETDELEESDLHKSFIGDIDLPESKWLNLRSGDKWDPMLQGVSDIATLPDPTGTALYTHKLHDSLELYRVSCPIGVLLVIF